MKMTHNQKAINGNFKANQYDGEKRELENSLFSKNCKIVLIFG